MWFNKISRQGEVKKYEAELKKKFPKRCGEFHHVILFIKSMSHKGRCGSLVVSALDIPDQAVWV